MRRNAMLPILPTLAAATVVGHLGYHLATNDCDGQSHSESARVIQGPVVEAPPPPVPPPSSCVDRLPVEQADWRPMAAALRLHLMERPGSETAHFARGQWTLMQRLEACQVQLNGDLTDLHARTAMGGTWFGAHFRKNDVGWTVFRLDGGDIR